MSKTMYRAGSNGADPTDRERMGLGAFCVSGPGQGLGYHSWALYPDRQFESLDQAETVASMCDDAYRAGRQSVQRELRELIGAK